MADLRPQHDEEVVAANHPTKADVTNRAWNVEHDEDGTHKFLGAETGTIMLFGQTAAPTGWTRKADWQDNAMLCYASAGAIGSGGTINPQSTHTHSAGTLAACHYVATNVDRFKTVGMAAWTATKRITHNFTEVADASSKDEGIQCAGVTGANAAPHYQEVIAATKD